MTLNEILSRAFLLPNVFDSRGHGAFKNESGLSVSSKSDISDCAFHFDSGLKKFKKKGI